MKKIWARIGMSLEVSDAEYEVIKQMSINKETSKEYGYTIYNDINFDQDYYLTKEFLTRGVADGESYIPAQIFVDAEETETDFKDMVKRAKEEAKKQKKCWIVITISFENGMSSEAFWTLEEAQASVRADMDKVLKDCIGPGHEVYTEFNDGTDGNARIEVENSVLYYEWYWEPTNIIG